MVRDEGPCSLQWGVQRDAWDKRPMCGDTPFMFGSWVWPEGCLAVLFAQLNPYLSLNEETGQRGLVHQGHSSMSHLNEHNLTSPNDLSGPNDSVSHCSYCRERARLLLHLTWIIVFFFLQLDQLPKKNFKAPSKHTWSLVAWSPNLLVLRSFICQCTLKSPIQSNVL